MLGLLAAACLAVPAAAAPAETDWLGRINEIRAASQLPPVVEEPAWSAGILAHLNYLAHTSPELETGPYASAHTENPASPAYSEAGAYQAEHSNLGSAGSNVGAIDVWLGAPFHAIGILRPALRQVAFARDPTSGEAGLNVISGLEESNLFAENVPPPQQVLFPGPGSTIDLNRFLGESPSPIETCEAQHPGADYSSPGLPLIALLSEPAAPGLTATLTEPDGTKVSSTGPDLCTVTAEDFVTHDPVYGPTGKDILETDQAVFVISRVPLVKGAYAVDIAQPGHPDIAWSFDSEPKPEPVQLGSELKVLARGSTARISAATALLGKLVAVTIRREWVPCALVLRAPRCTWTSKGHARRMTVGLAHPTVIHFRPPAAWEKVLITARTQKVVLGLKTYLSSAASTTLTGIKPHHVAR
jgi:hypothetical protein